MHYNRINFPTRTYTLEERNAQAIANSIRHIEEANRLSETADERNAALLLGILLTPQKDA